MGPSYFSIYKLQAATFAAPLEPEASRMELGLVNITGPVDFFVFSFSKLNSVHTRSCFTVKIPLIGTIYRKCFIHTFSLSWASEK